MKLYAWDPSVMLFLTHRFTQMQMHAIYNVESAGVLYGKGKVASLNALFYSIEFRKWELTFLAGIVVLYWMCFKLEQIKGSLKMN